MFHFYNLKFLNLVIFLFLIYFIMIYQILIELNFIRFQLTFEILINLFNEHFAFYFFFIPKSNHYTNK